MAFEFTMPEVGEGVTEALLVEWFVSVGDPVEVDQVLCAVLVDKADLEICSTRAGTVIELHGAPGDLIEVYSPLVELDLVDEPGAVISQRTGRQAVPPPPSARADQRPADRVGARAPLVKSLRRSDGAGSTLQGGPVDPKPLVHQTAFNVLPKDPALRRCSSCMALVHPSAVACPGCGKCDPYVTAEEIVRGGAQVRAAIIAAALALLVIVAGMVGFLFLAQPVIPLGP